MKHSVPLHSLPRAVNPIDVNHMIYANYIGVIYVFEETQDVGDNIMFFPASDGGVDIYLRDILNPKRQSNLETLDWQGRLFDF